MLTHFIAIPEHLELNSAATVLVQKEFQVYVIVVVIMNLLCVVDLLLEFAARNAEAAAEVFDAIVINRLLKDDERNVEHVEGNEPDKVHSLKLIRQHIEPKRTSRPLINRNYSCIFIFKRIALQDCIIRKQKKSANQMAREGQFQEVYHLINNGLVVVSGCPVEPEYKRFVNPINHHKITNGNWKQKW